VESLFCSVPKVRRFVGGNLRIKSLKKQQTENKMAIVPRLFPSIQKEKKPSYVRYIQKRNFLISLISISVFIGVCLILFTILCMVLLKKQLIRDKDGHPYKEGWFLWPMWIFYCIAMAIVANQVFIRYKEFAALRLEVFPPQHEHQPSSSSLNSPSSNIALSSEQQSIQLQDETSATSSGQLNNNSQPTVVNYREEDDEEDMMMSSKKERKQQKVRLTAV